MWLWMKFGSLFVLFAFGLISNRAAFAFRVDESTLRSTDQSAHAKVHRPAFPLRDTADYDSKYDEDGVSYDDEYDGYDDGEDEAEPGVDGDSDDNDVHRLLLDSKQSKESDGRKFVLQTLNGTANAGPDAPATANDSAENCPKECSCLNDFMDCIRLNLDQLPQVPQWIRNL